MSEWWGGIWTDLHLASLAQARWYDRLQCGTRQPTVAPLTPQWEHLCDAALRGG